MSKEMIIRLNTDEDIAEYAYKDQFGNVSFKKIKPHDLLKIISKIVKKEYTTKKKNIVLFENGIIGSGEDYVLVMQPECKKIVTYRTGEDTKVYKINFPNSLYIINFHDKKIHDIECYSYKEFKGKITVLFEYPLPNELIGNRICIGNADRSINDGKIVEALERIIFTPYSHSTFSGINGFTRTEAYFEYLEKNPFPYKMMKPLKKKLEDVLRG